MPRERSLTVATPLDRKADAGNVLILQVLPDPRQVVVDRDADVG
jgi:hypothetical protein